MSIRVQKCGDSLTLRIPKALELGAKFENNLPMEILLIDGRIVIKPVPRQNRSIELLFGVTSNNIQRETDTGDTVGNEMC